MDKSSLCLATPHSRMHGLTRAHASANFGCLFRTLHNPCSAPYLFLNGKPRGGMLLVPAKPPTAPDGLNPCPQCRPQRAMSTIWQKEPGCIVIHLHQMAPGALSSILTDNPTCNAHRAKNLAGLYVNPAHQPKETGARS